MVRLKASPMLLDHAVAVPAPPPAPATGLHQARSTQRDALLGGEHDAQAVDRRIHLRVERWRANMVRGEAGNVEKDVTS